MGRIGGPLGKSWGGAREALGGTLVQPFAAPRSLLHRRDGIGVPAQRHRRFKAIEHPFRAFRAGEKGALARGTPNF